MNASNPESQDTTPQDRAEEPIRQPRHRWPLWLALALLACAALGAAAWYFSQPHSPAEQFALAEKLEKRLLADGPRLAPADRDALRAKTLDAYRRVFSRFDPKSPEAPRAVARLAELEALAGQDQAARQWYRKLIDEYGQSDQARDSYAKLADSLCRAGRAIMGSDRPAGVRLLEEAAGTSADYVSRFGPSDPLADQAAMNRCRIFHDDIADPPILAIEALEEFVEAFGAGAGRNSPSPLLDEACWRLGRLYEEIAEYAQAAAWYKRVADQWPASKYLKDCQIGYARNLEQYDPDAAEQVWMELAVKYPDDAQIRQRLQRYADKEADQKTQQALKDDQQYRQQRYGGGGGGGGGHLDTSWGKPIPPTEMLRDFIEQKLNAIRYEITVQLDPDTHNMNVAGTVELVNEGNDKKHFLLMLGSLFEPGEFSLDGQKVQVDRPQGKDDVVQIRVDQGWKAGATATLAFAYEAEVPPLPPVPEEFKTKMVEQLAVAGISAWAMGSPAAHREPMRGGRSWLGTGPGWQPALGSLQFLPLATGNLQPSSARGDDFDPSSYMTHPGLQLQINDSGYALCGVAWYPVTIFGDLFTAELDFEMKGEQELVCSGRRIELPDPDPAGLRRTSWQCERQVFGLYFAYGPYNVVRREHDGMELAGYFTDNQADKIEPYLDEAAKIVSFYIERFGSYPFEKLTLLEVDLPPVLGGVGPASMVFLHTLAVSKSDTVLGPLLAHELAHQWWGNQVPINLIDPKYSQWLSEGFATYCDALYTEQSKGTDAFVEQVRKMQKLYLDASAAMREEPIATTFMGQNPLYRPVVYEKGAMVLHALRFLLGDEAFFSLLKEYARRYAFRPNTVDDFRKLAGEISGKELDWFFDEWLDRPGCPRFVISDVQSASVEETAANQLIVLISQPEQLSHMPLEIEVEGPGREIVRIRRELGKKENQVVIDLPFPASKVQRVQLDSDSRVLRRPGKTNDRPDDLWEPPAF